MQYGFKLDPGEEIQKIIHRHIFDVLPSLFFALVLALAAGGMSYILGRFPSAAPFPPQLMLILIMLMALIAVVIFLVAIYVYGHNLLIFTNMHIVQIEQLALFQRRVSQLNLRRIEDVTGVRQGFLQTLFDYGEVQIQSAGEQEKFIFRNAPHPQELADEALQKHELSLRQAGAGPAPEAPFQNQEDMA
jgi:uncharacterized membrane protein YdbT with pleckstrin-like domain